MFRRRFPTTAAVFMMLATGALLCSESAHAQLLRRGRLRARFQQVEPVRPHRVAPANEAWVEDNLQHSLDNQVGVAAELVHPRVGQAMTVHDTVKAADNYFNSGTPGSFTKAAQALVGAFSGPLGQAGVGPQAGFLAKFVEMANDYAAAKHDEATAAVRSGFAESNFESYKRFGNPSDLGRAVFQSQPRPTHRQLKEWDTKKPLRIKTHPGMPGHGPGSVTGSLSKDWKVTVRKKPFDKTGINSPLERVQRWTDWKLDRNNFHTHGQFDRSFHHPDGGTTHVRAESHRTGYGYQPGETMRRERIRTEYHAPRVKRITPPQRHAPNVNLRPSNRSFSRPSFQTPSFQSPSFSRPSPPNF